MLDTVGFDNNIKGYNEIGKKEAIYNFLKDNEIGKKKNLDEVKETFIKFKKINDVVGKFDTEKLKITKQLLGFNQSWLKTININYNPKIDEKKAFIIKELAKHKNLKIDKLVELINIGVLDKNDKRAKDLGLN